MPTHSEGMWVKWRRAPRRARTTIGRKHYEAHREAARALIHERIAVFNTYYQLDYNRVAIRNQRRCWGSCSAQRNLNFSYKLLFLPPCIRDYIIVHELCHLRELNHSSRFWNAVAETLPDFRERAATLRVFERTHGTSVKALTAWEQSHSECDFCTRD